MKEKRGKRRIMKGLAILLVLALVYLGVCFCFGPLRYRAFYAAAEQIGTYCGLKEEFVPQGMTQDEASGAYLVTTTRSVFYFVVLDSKAIRMSMQIDTEAAVVGGVGSGVGCAYLITRYL